MIQRTDNECVGSRLPVGEPAQSYALRLCRCPVCGREVVMLRRGTVARHGYELRGRELDRIERQITAAVARANAGA